MDNAKVVSAIAQAAAEFINRESNRRSLITVTKVQLGERGMRGIIFVSIFPDSAAAPALEFLNRVREDFRDHVKKTIKMRMIPYFTFQQDPNIGGVIVGEAPPIE
ncbi:MAG: ribosome-binding factor A [Patescibacteria group bacterium]